MRGQYRQASRARGRVCRKPPSIRGVVGRGRGEGTLSEIFTAAKAIRGRAEESDSWESRGCALACAKSRLPRAEQSRGGQQPLSHLPERQQPLIEEGGVILPPGEGGRKARPKRWGICKRRRRHFWEGEEKSLLFRADLILPSRIWRIGVADVWRAQRAFWGQFSWFFDYRIRLLIRVCV